MAEELGGGGACGEISGRLFDAAGQAVCSDLDDRVIGISWEQLHAVGRLIVSSHGAYRRDATLAAVRAGLVHTLVIDADLAHALLEKTPPRP